MNQPHCFKHHFLVAMPNLVDFNFSKSVIYLYEHDEEGALGLIINKPLKLSMGNVLEHLGIKPTNNTIINRPVLMGGPISQENGFIMFAEDSKEPCVSASKDLLQDIASDKGPKDYLVALGYAGWEVGQLEAEIARNDWLVAPFNYDILFKTPIHQRWQATAALMGVDILHLSGQVGHA